MNDVIDNDFDAPGFSIKTGYYLACASNFAYEEDLGDWTERLGLVNIKFFTCGQFHGFVGILEKIVLLAFRGTQSIANCLTDLEAILVSQPPYPGRVHSGFARAVEEVFPSVRRLLPSSARSTPLWITGHSLGGAMATLASVRLAHAGYPVRAVYTYGSPRVGDRHFRNFYHWPNYRFVCGNDLVPHLPFRWCYKHVGHLRLLDHQGNLTGEKTAWRAKKRALAKHAKHVQRSNRHKTAVHEECGDFDWLADHHLDRYLDAIGKIVRRTSRRRRMDRPHDRPYRVPAYVHRKDLASAGVPLPASNRGGNRKFTISEADFIAAFFKQPREQSWLPARSSFSRSTQTTGPSLNNGH
jgi:triacylglycerol lipase